MDRQPIARRGWRQVAFAVASAVLAVPFGLLGIAPASAVTEPSTYDTTSYVYDAPIHLSTPDAADTTTPSSPSGPGAASWGRSVAAGRIGSPAGTLAATTCDDAGVAAANTAVPIAEGNAAHIFRSDLGHLAQDTLANRAVIQSAADSGVLVRTTPAGVQTFYQLLPDGTQAWARVFRGEITNGGVNVVPRAS